MTQKNTPRLDKLLSALAEHPEDPSLRARAARALEAEGRVEEAFALLNDHLLNLTAHEEGSLPCLCRRCIAPGTRTAAVEGEGFYREFAAAEGKVLYFWVLDEIPRRPTLTRAVEVRLGGRVRAATKKRRR